MVEKKDEVQEAHDTLLEYTLLMQVAIFSSHFIFDRLAKDSNDYQVQIRWCKNLPLGMVSIFYLLLFINTLLTPYIIYYI